MSNTKSVRIVAEMPFNWLSELDECNAAGVGRLLLGPAMGLLHTYRRLEDRPNQFGGKTAMYRLEIMGVEAFDVRDLIDGLQSVGTVLEAKYTDLDNGNREHVVV